MRKVWFLILIIQGLLMSAEIKYIDYKGLNIPVIFERDTTLPTFNLQLIFKNAGYIQDGKTAGIANVTSSILNEGTKELGNVEFAKLLENKAIHLNVANGFETFVFEVSSLKEFQKDSIGLLGRLLFSPNITPKTLSKVKTLIGGKLKRKESDFDFVANNGLNKILFAKTPLENSNLGNIESVNKINSADIKKFVNDNLILNNLVIVCGGDVKFEEFSAQIKDVLEHISMQSKNKQQEYYFNVFDGAVSAETKKITEQAFVYFGSPFEIKPNDKEIYLAKVASFILGGSGFGSRLMEEIRVKKGLAYSVSGNISSNKTYSNFSGHLQTKLESSDEAIALVKEIVHNFVKNGVTQKELDGAKMFLSGSEPLRVETLSQRLNRAFFLYYKGLAQDYPQKELDMIETISLDEINNFIKKHNEIVNLSFFVVKK